jgi:hypothetical protein
VFPWSRYQHEDITISLFVKAAAKANVVTVDATSTLTSVHVRTSEDDFSSETEGFSTNDAPYETSRLPSGEIVLIHRDLHSAKLHTETQKPPEREVVALRGETTTEQNRVQRIIKQLVSAVSPARPQPTVPPPVPKTALRARQVPALKEGDVPLLTLFTSFKPVAEKFRAHAM